MCIQLCQEFLNRRKLSPRQLSECKFNYKRNIYTLRNIANECYLDEQDNRENKIINKSLSFSKWEVFNNQFIHRKKYM